MNNTARNFFSAATVVVFGVGMVAAAGPASAATFYQYTGACDPGLGHDYCPGATDAAPAPLGNRGAMYYPGEGGDVNYDFATDGGLTNGPGPYHRGHVYRKGIHKRVAWRRHSGK